MLDLNPIILSVELALCTSAILFIISVPLACWLSFSRFKFKAPVEAIVSLPLVLPPTVLGFYFLLAFSPENTFGKFLSHYLDMRLIFTFPGLVVASVIYSLPFMVHPIQSGLRSLPENFSEASYLLGKSKFTTLTRVLLPNIKASLITGIVLTFAHTIGEFGVVLMVGGDIPNQTKVVSVAICDEVQSLNYHNANIYAGILLVFAFLILLSISIINNRRIRKTDIL